MRSLSVQILAFDSVVFAALLMVFSGINFNMTHLGDLLSSQDGQFFILATILAAVILVLAIRGHKQAKYAGAVFYLITAGFFGIVSAYVLSDGYKTTSTILLLISLLNLAIFVRQIMLAEKGKAAAPKKKAHPRKR